MLHRKFVMIKNYLKQPVIYRELTHQLFHISLVKSIPSLMELQLPQPSHLKKNEKETEN